MKKDRIEKRPVEEVSAIPDNLLKPNFGNKSNYNSIEIEGNIMETLFKELKDDMREREQRMEQRYQEQQELLLIRIDKRLDDSLSEMKSEITSIKQDVKDIKNSTFRWGLGLIVTILVALIGALPQIINIIVELVKLIPNS